MPPADVPTDDGQTIAPSGRHGMAWHGMALARHWPGMALARHGVVEGCHRVEEKATADRSI
jgi:hypothetical protein